MYTSGASSRPYLYFRRKSTAPGIEPATYRCSGLEASTLTTRPSHRDLMLAGTQQSVELKLALDQEQLKSKKLEESMRKLDEEMKRTDELLYQMIPKQVADRLRNGESPIDTCEMFDSVSILFSDVVTFTEICSRITPMEVVSMLNAMYSLFDTLTERNHVYKVETIGDAYMVVSGAPAKENDHADRVCDMALDMVEAITDLKDRSTGDHLQIRVGVHSGAVVAGIVGLKMPRYCLFGDSVNTASRMEATSEAMQIHISQSTRELLSPSFKVKERGEIQVKGKGSMKTYWLEKRHTKSFVTRGIMISEPQWMSRAAEKRLSGSSTGATSVVLSAKSDRHTYHNDATTTAARRPSSRLSSPTQGSCGFLHEERRIYSPITFQDVARRSVANSPTKNADSREMRSNSVGAMTASIRNPSSVFGSLLSDTEEHFRLHRDSTSSRDRESAGVHVKPETNKGNTISSTITTAPTTTSTTTATFSSSDSFRDGAVMTSMEIGSSGRSGNAVEFSRTADSNDSISTSQLLVRQDQCCPGFAISKSGKPRNQGNGCSIS